MHSARKKILTLFLLATVMQAIFYAKSWGQRKKIDSLENMLSKTSSTNHIDILNSISALFITKPPIDRLMNKPARDSVHFYAVQSLKESFKIDYKKGLADAYCNLVLIEWDNLFDLRAIEKYARFAIPYLQQLKDKRLADAFQALGNALWGQSEFDEAIKSYEKAATLYKENKDSIASFQMRNWIAGVYLEWGYYAKSFQFTNLAFESKDKNSMPKVNLASLYFEAEDYQTTLDYLHELSIFDSLNNITDTYHYYIYIRTFSATKQYDSALYFCQKWADEMAFNSADSESKRISLRWPDEHFGDIYLLEKKFDLALQKLQSALLLFEQSNDVNQIMWILLRIGRCYLELGNMNLAFQNAHELLIYANRTGARQYMRDGSQLMWNIYDQLGKKDSAYYFLTNYTILKDTLDADRSIQKLAYFKYIADLEKKQSQIELQKKEIRNESILKAILLGGIVAVLLLTAIVFRNITLMRRNESHRRELAENELQIQKLEHERTKVELQQQATELEMQALRSQMNPHFIFNSLNSINRFILQNEKAEASEYLTKFSRLVRLILQNSQAALIPLESELESLELYLELESLRFDHRFEYKISVPKDLDIEMIKVPPLIIQPYSENAIWHGLMNKEEKGHLKIEISQEKNYLLLKIIDDGIGRKAASELESKNSNKHKSVGLKITAERIAVMQNLNGQESPVIINDLVNPDGSAGGTEVIIKLPLVY